MKYELADRTINIPDEDIATLRRTLDLNTTQAIALWLFDHDIKDDADAENISSKQNNKKKNEKKMIMEWIQDALQPRVSNMEARSSDRILSFSLGSNKYELTLTKKRS